MRTWLKKLREQHGLSQKEISERLSIKPNYYSMIENGERQKRLSMELAQRIADVFGISLDYISEQESEVR